MYCMGNYRWHIYIHIHTYMYVNIYIYPLYIRLPSASVTLSAKLLPWDGQEKTYPNYMIQDKSKIYSNY